MAKRAVRLILAVIIPIMLLCGCSSGEKRLTAEEYRAAVEGAWDKYINSILDMIEITPLTVDEAALKEFAENAEKAQPALKMREQSFKEFKEMNPPEKYEGLHKKLLAAMDAWEYEQLELHRKLFEVKTVDELREITDRIAEHAENSSEDSFPTVYILLMKELSADNVK